MQRYCTAGQSDGSPTEEAARQDPSRERIQSDGLDAAAELEDRPLRYALQALAWLQWPASTYTSRDFSYLAPFVLLLLLAISQSCKAPIDNANLIDRQHSA